MAMTLAQAEREYLALEAEIKRRYYLAAPDGIERWIHDTLGEFAWSKQREILRAIQTHRKVAVPSCYGPGKSWLASRLAAHWIANHPPGTARVITTATTGAQVKAILWSEIATAHARGRLPGRLNQTEWYLPVPETAKDGTVTIVDKLVAFGRKPADMDANAFQGIHERYVLVIVDEAAGVPTPLMDAALGLLTNEESRILLIGNPDDGAGSFAKACEPGSGWHVVQIHAFMTPNFTGEDVPVTIKQRLVSKIWVDEVRHGHGEESSYYKAKVLAEFPETRTDGLIPLSWIRAAQERTLVAEGASELGVDVGGGGDRNVVAHRHGPVVRIVRRNNQPNTMVSCGNVVADLKEYKAFIAKIDEIGIGRGMTERGREQGKPFVGINVGAKADDSEAFINLRAEGYWGLRKRFQDGSIDIDPNDQALASQLRELRFKRNSRGQIQIESKDDMKRRGVASPDDADAVMLAFITPKDPGPTAGAVLPRSETGGDWRKAYYQR